MARHVSEHGNTLQANLDLTSERTEQILLGNNVTLAKTSNFLFEEESLRLSLQQVISNFVTRCFV